MKLEGLTLAVHLQPREGLSIRPDLQRLRSVLEFEPPNLGFVGEESEKTFRLTMPPPPPGGVKSLDL